MSANVVEKAHIDALIEAGISFCRPPVGRGDLAWFVPADPQPGDYQRGSWTGPTAMDSYTARRRVLNDATADRVGAMLWNENRRSVDHRYDEHAAENPFVYQFTHRYGRDWPLSPVKVLKALQCYEYQSCEHPEWERSEAKAFCDALRLAAISRLPGYEAAPWSVHDRTEVEIDRPVPAARRGVPA